MPQIIIHGIELTDFIKQISEIIDEKLKENFEKAPIEKKSEYLNRFEVAEILKISLPTLNNWSKAGILQSYRIGNRVLYKQDEIDQAVHEVKNLKHKRG